jgi:hypothetical protein
MTTLAIELKLDEKDVRLICTAVPGNFSDATKVGRVALSLLRDLSEGGLMIPGDAVSRLRKALSSIDPSEIVSAVEKSANRDGDHITFPVTVDPSWMPRLNEIAEVRGCPVIQIMQEVTGSVLAQNWLWDNVVPPEPPPVSFSRQDYESLRNVVSAGGPVFGEDIAAWVRGHGEMAKHAG